MAFLRIHLFLLPGLSVCASLVYFPELRKARIGKIPLSTTDQLIPYWACGQSLRGTARERRLIGKALVWGSLWIVPKSRIGSVIIHTHKPAFLSKTSRVRAIITELLRDFGTINKLPQTSAFPINVLLCFYNTHLTNILNYEIGSSGCVSNL